MKSEQLTEEQKAEIKRQLEEEAEALREFDRWTHKEPMMRLLRREAFANQSAFDAAFADPRFSADISHGAALISGMQNLLNILIINIEQAKQCLQSNPQKKRARRRRFTAVLS